MSPIRKNMGTADRWLRFGLGVILLILGIFFNSLILSLGALFVFLEAMFSWCIVFQFMGKSTCPVKRNKNQD